MKELLIKYKNVAAYLFFGVCTTLINIIAYYVCARLMSLDTAVSTIIAWFVAVLFAFLTNKSWVFGSRIWETNIILREIVSFYLCRLTTGIIDLFIMLVTVDILGWNDMLMKFLSNMLVIILNFIASKFIIFKRGRSLSNEKD